LAGGNVAGSNDTGTRTGRAVRQAAADDLTGRAGGGVLVAETLLAGDAVAGDAVAGDALAEELLVEEISIDGMCGVY
jgi:mycofactocin precursor